VGIDAHSLGIDMRSLGFDMTEHHEPQLGVLRPDAFRDGPLRSRLKRNLKRGIVSSTFKIYSYDEAVDCMNWIRPTFPHFPCCFVGWDNTARRGRHAIIIVGSTPESFRRVLARVAGGVLNKDPEERVVFINAWNEWAEGMYLEPDAKFGHGWLEAVASVIAEVRDRRTSLSLH
jgi:hypothetical protein